MANYGLLDTSIPGQAQNTLMSAFNQTQDRLKAGRLSDLQYQNTERQGMLQDSQLRSAERQGKLQDFQLQTAERTAARDARADAYIQSPEVQASYERMKQMPEGPEKEAERLNLMDGLVRATGVKDAEAAMGYMKSRAEADKPIAGSEFGLYDRSGKELVPPVAKRSPNPAWLKDDGTIDQTIYEGYKGLNPKFSMPSGGGTPSSVNVGVKPNLGNINAALRRQDKELEPITKNQAARANIEGLIGSASPATLPQIKAVLTNYLNTARITNKQYGDQTSFGNIYQRSVNALDRFINGDLTDANKQMILKMVRDMDSSVFEPARKNIVSRHKHVFETLGVDPSLADNENPYAANGAGEAPSSNTSSSVTLPNGQVKVFPTPEAAAAFKKDAGL